MPDIYTRNSVLQGAAVSNITNMESGTSVIPTLKEVADNNSKIIYQLKSVFPFDFFPTTITIDLQKVSIDNQLFFFSRQVMSIPITEIFVVECDTDLLFATLRIKDKRYEQQPMETGFLKKDEAKQARRILQGLIAVYDQHLDMAGMSLDEIRESVEKIGTTEPHS